MAKNIATFIFIWRIVMNTPEVILCKFGEVVLKGANRQSFESGLVKELRRRATQHGLFKIYF